MFSCALRQLHMSYYRPKCEGNMAGYWPFFGIFVNGDRVKIHKHPKKERGQYPAILSKQGWLVRDTVGSTERAR